MSVFDIIRTYLTQDISDEQLEARAIAIAHEVELDLTSIYDPESETFNEPNVKFIAEEIDKQSGSIALIPNSNSIDLVTEKPGKKTRNTKNKSTGHNPVEDLKPVIIQLNQTISSRATTMKNIVARKVEEKENSIVDDLVRITNGMESNIVGKFTAELKKRSEENKNFLEEFESAFDEAWGN
jgi:hypothetical protein